MRTFVLGMVLLALAGYAAAAIYVKNQRQEGFDLVKIGDTATSVKDIMGSPDAVKERDVPFPRYSDRPCEDPCSERLWYEDRLLLDIEGWSIDVGQDGAVIGKYHWVSP